MYLSGCEVGRFQHRISLERVIALSVAGEVSLTNVVFTEASDPPLLTGFSCYKSSTCFPVILALGYDTEDR